MQKQLYVVCTLPRYTTCLSKAIEHYMNISIMARIKLNTAKN